MARNSGIAILAMWLSQTVMGATSILQGNSHASTDVAPAITAVLGPGHIDTDIFVDSTGTPTTVSYLNMSNYMADTSATYLRTSTGASTNHAPYPVGGLSSCCWTPVVDSAAYSALVSHGQIFTFGYAKLYNSLPSGTQPPALISTASASNSINGGSGPGIEFGLSPSYLGLDTSADSWITAELSGFYISMEFQHPTWNAWDVKAAFRQTAGNWATGYNEGSYGYGTLSYSAATAVSGPSSLYLQPPELIIQNNGYWAQILMLPFRQARRDHELLYSVSSSYTFPVKNEYTAADISASGATLLYTSNGTDMTPTYIYAPPASGTITFIAFTTDGLGNFSRAESFSKQSVSLIVGTSCLH